MQNPLWYFPASRYLVAIFREKFILKRERDANGISRMRARHESLEWSRRTSVLRGILLYMEYLCSEDCPVVQ